MPSTTTVVVASRLATIALADRVLYLEDGRLVADGDHDRLLATTPATPGWSAPTSGPRLGGGPGNRRCPRWVGAERVAAIEQPMRCGLRRGLAASPELRKGRPSPWPGPGGRGGRVVTPVLVQQTIDRHVVGGTARLQGMLVLAGTGLALILVAAWAARTTSQRLATASERALCGLRVRAFNHIHALSMAHHTEEQRGALVSRVTSDVETLGQFFRWGGLAWVINSALMLAALVAMLVYDWRLALVAVATVACPWWPCSGSCSAGWWWPGTPSAPWVGESLAAISESIQGGGGDPRLRRPGPGPAPGAAHGRGPPPGRDPGRHHRRLLLSLRGAVRRPARRGRAAGRVGHRPRGGLTAGTLVAFAFLVTIFLEPVAEFTEILDMTQQAVAGWKKVLDVLDTPVEVEDPRPGLTLPARALDIELDRVSFAYHGGPPVLVDVSVAIPAGTRVALVGTTGSGKTTLAKLLIRLADPTAGTIRVAGSTCAGSAWPRCARRWSWSPRTASCSTPAREERPHGPPRRRRPRGAGRVRGPGAWPLGRRAAAGRPHPGRRARRLPVGGRAPAGRPGPRLPGRPGLPDPGRGHLGGRPGHRGGAAQRHPAAHRGPHRLPSPTGWPPPSTPT